MSVHITPSITPDALFPCTVNDPYPTDKRGDYSQIFSIEAKSDVYRLTVPAAIDVTDQAERKARLIQDSSIRDQIIDVLSAIQNKLNYDCKDIPNRLPKLHLTEIDDGSVLVEWNFQYTRIGFSFEPNKDDSFFYIVSANKSENVYDSLSRPLWRDFSAYLPSLITTAIQNT